MNIIINKNTGEVLYCSNVNVDTNANEQIVKIEELNFIKPYYNFQTQEFYETFVETEPSDEEIFQQSLDEETTKYLQRIQDGTLAVAKLSAELRVAKLNGIITEENQKYVEELLVPVRTEILAGQWIGARDLMLILGDSLIGEDLYNRIFNEITTYIENNY